MTSYVVYDTLLGEDTSRRRKVRVDKHPSLDEAMRSAQTRFLRFARAPRPGESVERVTVETADGEIVYELPQAGRS